MVTAFVRVAFVVVVVVMMTAFERVIFYEPFSEGTGGGVGGFGGV